MLNQLKAPVKRYARARGHSTSELRPARLVDALLQHLAARRGFGLTRIDSKYPYPIARSLDPRNVDLIGDRNFQASLRAARNYTILDDDRLANLWLYARIVGPGKLAEVGTFRGGAALHIANACPEKHLFVFDPFSEAQSFQTLRPGLDQNFTGDQFTDTSLALVDRLLGTGHGRKYTLVRGFFPESAVPLDIHDFAFVHLDVDVYEATSASLNYLAERLARRSVVMLDDYQRNARGVDRAVAEFLSTHEGFMCLPLFPGQGVLFSPALWS